MKTNNDWKQRAKAEGKLMVKVSAAGIWVGVKAALPLIKSAFKSLSMTEKDWSKLSAREAKLLKDEIFGGWFLVTLPVTAPLFFYILYKVTMWL